VNNPRRKNALNASDLSQASPNLSENLQATTQSNLHIIRKKFNNVGYNAKNTAREIYIVTVIIIIVMHCCNPKYWSNMES